MIRSKSNKIILSTDCAIPYCIFNIIIFILIDIVGSTVDSVECVGDIYGIRCCILYWSRFRFRILHMLPSLNIARFQLSLAFLKHDVKHSVLGHFSVLTWSWWKLKSNWLDIHNESIWLVTTQSLPSKIIFGITSSIAIDDLEW